MSYIALARKWRPRTFSQLVGQEHINKALINSLNQQRLHHAYLFTGTRGVGKTSIARLLAKALNCEQGIGAEPCLECDICLSIEQGRFIDLIEIDGASRTRVEDTREILDNVQYAPANGRFKIYLIDEVHMLSQHSFNALLKTLEEPPAHVKFLLATTDPQKLPVTVLSRCLQFNLKPLLTEVICQHLQDVLNDESYSFELPALEILANAARGSMRDALSLLDQAIASSDNHLRTHDIKNMLGHTQQDYALQLLQALAESNPQQLLTISQQIAAEGGNFHYVLDEMLNHLHQITVSQSLANATPHITSTPEILAMSAQFIPENVQLFYQIGLKGIEEMHLAPTLTIGFEMTLLRMHTFKPAPTVPMPPLAYKTAGNNPPVTRFLPSEQVTPSDPSREIKNIDGVEKVQVQEMLSDVSLSSASNTANLPTPSPNPEKSPTEKKSRQEEPWDLILPQLKLSGLAQNAAENAEFIQKSNREFVLGIAKGHRSVFTKTVTTRIEEALSRYYNEVIKLTLKSDDKVVSTPALQKKTVQAKQHLDAAAALQNDPFLQQLQQEFSAEMVKNSISTSKNDL